jgi:hypothetical protein
VDSRQKANVVKIMRDMFGGKGHIAFRSPTQLVFYRRSDAENPDRLSFTLQTRTGGAANRASLTRATTGREALDEFTATGWLAGDAASRRDLRSLESDFLELFPDGVAYDLETGAGQAALRGLEQSVLVRLLPTAMRSLDEGTSVASASTRLITPIFDSGRLHAIFILPADFDGALLRRWRHRVREWQTPARVEQVSSA